MTRLASVGIVCAVALSAAGLADASDLSEALTLAKAVMGDHVAAGFEDFEDRDPNEAVAMLLSPVIEPDRPLAMYRESVPSLEGHPHFVSLGARRLNFEILRPYIEEAARESRLPIALIDAVIRTESGYRPEAVSRSGAKGLMQLMPETAKALGLEDPLDPRANVRAGARYLRQLYDRFGSLPLAVAAYNAGPARVAKARAVPEIAETKRYVSAVLKRFTESPLN